MALMKEECGHPMEWNLRVIYNGTKYSYCLGCIVERLQLDNLETYNNPFIKLDKKKESKPTKEKIISEVKIKD